MDEGVAAMNGALAAAAAAAAPAEPQNDSDLSDGTRCSIKKCPIRNVVKYRCSNESCDRTAHLTCYTGLILGKHPDLKPLPENLIAHCKKCHNEIWKRLNPGSGNDKDGRATWDCDGKNGKEDPHTSTKILIDWWTEQGNYEKYRGKNNNGTKKVQYAEKLAEKMRKETASTNRTSTEVKAKIAHVEASWRRAHEWATSETGAGLLESDDAQQIQSFEDTLLKRCKHYRDLEDIMIDRASNQPKLMSYDLDMDDSEDDIDNLEDDDEASKPAAVVDVPRSGKKKRKSSVSDASVFSEDVVGAMQQASQARIRQHDEKMQESKRHNCAMERIAETQLEVQQERDKWEKERDKWEKERLERKDKIEAEQQNLKLSADKLTQYNSMKAQGLSDETILIISPALKDIVDAFRQQHSDT